MAKKTCIRRLEPFLPKSTELSRAFVLDGSVATGVTADSTEVDTTFDYYIDVIDDAETGEIPMDESSDSAVDGSMFEREI